MKKLLLIIAIIFLSISCEKEEPEVCYKCQTWVVYKQEAPYKNGYRIVCSQEEYNEQMNKYPPLETQTTPNKYYVICEIEK